MIVTIRDDFDLRRIAESGQCFRWEEQADGGYRIPHGSHCLTIRPAGAETWQADCDGKEWQDVWRPYFDLDHSYAEIRGRIRRERDPFLYAAAEAQKGLRILRQDPWETLVSFIISQNRHIPMIRRSVAALCERAGEKKRDASGRVFFAFPAPEAILEMSGADLDACRLGYRARYVLSAAQAAREGLFPLPPDFAGAEKRLLGVCGVGIKVASCVMLFGLHHLDAFPVDVWMKRILNREYPDGFPLDDYRPYNGICQQYLFAWERERNLKARGGSDQQTQGGQAPSRLSQ